MKLRHGVKIVKIIRFCNKFKLYLVIKILKFITQYNHQSLIFARLYL